MIRYMLLFLFCSTAYAAQVDLDLSVAKTHRDHIAKECKAKPPTEAKKCLADLDKTYADVVKDIKERAAKENKK